MGNQQPDLILYTDASLLGWGATCQGVQIGGAWSLEERSLHINCLELVGAWNAVQSFCQGKTNLVVLIWMDNTSAISYINHMGGTRLSALAQIAVQFWTWALQKEIVHKARHIAGVENVTADRMSQMIVRDWSDWLLNPTILSKIVALWGPFQVDMFATRLSTLLPGFYSWKAEPLAEATDAFLQDWSTLRGYAHPPWCLIQRCLKKVVIQETTLVMHGYSPLVNSELVPVNSVPLHRLSQTDPTSSRSDTAHGQHRSSKSKSSHSTGRLAYLGKSLRERLREELLQRIKNSCCQHGEVRLT